MQEQLGLHLYYNMYYYFKIFFLIKLNSPKLNYLKYSLFRRTTTENKKNNAH